MARIPVQVGAGYQVVVGRGLIGRLEAYLPKDVVRVMVMYAPALSEVTMPLAERLRGGGLEVHALSVPDGEAAKTIDVAQAAWQRLGEASFTRTDLIVTIGGGATTDLGGFVAATWLRGIRVVHVPTTLLGMVDAAIGGKTGIDTVQGKNLVGAFHQPSAVICDCDQLDTLPRPELVSGMAEVIKTGFVADRTILDVIWSGPQEALNPRGPLMPELVSRSVAVKAEVVSQDPQEAGWRAILNYGHTLGHAIELVEDYSWRHGDAVAVGMVFAAEIAVRSGLLDPSILGAHREVLASVGLPTSYQTGNWVDLLKAMGRDKKNQGRKRRLVVLEGIGRPVILEGVADSVMHEAYQAVAAVAAAKPYPASSGEGFNLENPYGQALYVPPVDTNEGGDKVVAP
ncbi:MAG: 3-dehydroquinate synthase [Micrococcales bacterium]|nr:3-dehydroquinate synthase [Micrococcales bacterium]